MKDPETMWEAQNFETVCAWCVPSPETQHWERDAECKENTWPTCLTSWETASGWTVVLVHCMVRLPCCLKAGPTLVLQGPPGTLSFACSSKQKEDFLIAHFGNVHPLSDGGCSKCFLTNWETKEMNWVSAFVILNSSLFHQRWFVSVNPLGLVISVLWRKPCANKWTYYHFKYIERWL